MLRSTLSLFTMLLVASGCGENQTRVEREAFSPASEAATCRPNLDGAIEASELKAQLGVPASFLVSPAESTRAVDLVGVPLAPGKTSWDWSTDYAEDRVARIEASPLTDKWYAASFPTAQFAAPLDAAGQVDAVYAYADSALMLLGFASAQAAPPSGKTLMVYSSPVALYRFPLRLDTQWTSAGEIRNATFRGLPYAARDIYQVSVDGQGELSLPDMSFAQVLRVRVQLTVEPSVGLTVRRRQTQFLFECLGEVARASSQDNETHQDFTVAAEVRRLGL